MALNVDSLQCRNRSGVGGNADPPRTARKRSSSRSVAAEESPRRIEDMIARPVRFQQMMQREAVVACFVARDHLDLGDWPAQFPGNLMSQEAETDPWMPLRR
jgi:hypothetical protein